MAQAATTSDVFNAIAEQQRREILVLLRAGEGPVTELAHGPGHDPAGGVQTPSGAPGGRTGAGSQGRGRQRLYGLDARGLRPVHEWTGGFERFWNESFDRLDEYVQEIKQARQDR